MEGPVIYPTVAVQTVSINAFQFVRYIPNSASMSNDHPLSGRRIVQCRHHKYQQEYTAFCAAMEQVFMWIVQKVFSLLIFSDFC